MSCLKKGIITIVFSILLFSCTNDDDGDNANLPEKFPLSVGNKWDYDKTVSMMYKDDSTAVGISTAYNDSIILISEIFMEVLKDTVLEDSIPVFILETEEIPVNKKQQLYNDRDFYANREDGLYRYDSRQDIKRERKGKFCYKGIRFNSLSELKDILLNSYRTNMKSNITLSKILEYPFMIGNEWNEISIMSILDTRKSVTGTEIINVPAGIFDVYKVETYFDWGQDGDWEDDIKLTEYYSVFGLVKTRFEGWNMTQVDEQGTFLGYLDSFEEEVLRSYQVIIEE